MARQAGGCLSPRASSAALREHVYQVFDEDDAERGERKRRARKAKAKEERVAKA